MAVTLDEIEEFIKVEDLKYQYDKERKVILLVSGDKESVFAHYLRAKDDGKIFTWQMQILDDNKNNVSIKNHQYVSEVLSHVLYLNYQTKFGTWEYDPSDGDIRLAVELPLEDATMTQAQFHRIVGYMMGNGSDAADDIMHILKTGKAPKDSDDDIIEKLEAMLAMLKSQSSSSEDSI